MLLRYNCRLKQSQVGFDVAKVCRVKGASNVSKLSGGFGITLKQIQAATVKASGAVDSVSTVLQYACGRYWVKDCCKCPSILN